MRLPFALVRASWRAQKSPADPGTATDTNRSLPRMLIQDLLLTRLAPFSSVKIWARDSFRWAGSSIVCRMVSMIHPNTSLRVFQLPSPFNNFFRDMASLRCFSSSVGCAKISSTACSRCLRRTIIRFFPPWPSWMKSSTKTSLVPSGLVKGRLDGGPAMSGVVSGCRFGHSWSRALVAASSSTSRGRGSHEGERSSWALAASSRR